MQPKGEILFCKVRAGHGKQGKSWNLIDGPAKSLKIIFMLDRLYTADVKARTLSNKDYSNKLAWSLVDTRVCVWWTALANVKKYPKTRRFWKYSDSRPLGHRKSHGTWKLKRVQTLSLQSLHSLFNNRNANRGVPWSTWKSFLFCDYACHPLL